MIVSFLSNVPINDSREEKIKRHLENAVEYAVCEGGRLFLWDAGSDYGVIYKEVMDKAKKMHPYISYIPVEYTEDMISDTSEVRAVSGYGGSSTGTKLRNYLLNKADFVIVCEMRGQDFCHNFLKDKNSARIKI